MSWLRPKIELIRTKMSAIWKIENHLHMIDKAFLNCGHFFNHRLISSLDQAEYLLIRQGYNKKIIFITSIFSIFFTMSI